MKILYQRWNAGVLLILLVLLPYFLILPSMATTHTVYDNYDTETHTGTINVYYQSASAFQYVQEALDLPDSTLRIIVGAGFYYNTYSSTPIQIQAVDNSSSITTSHNLTLVNSSGVKNYYPHYFMEDPYLLSRGSHFIRLLGLNSSLLSVYYTSTENGSSYYSNESTGIGNWVLDSKQYFIQFIEEEVVNLSSSQTKTGYINSLNPVLDGVDAYLLDLPAQPVKIILEMNSSGENLNMELYNYSNDGDMLLQNPSVYTTGNFDPEILTYVPLSAGLHVLLVKPNDIYADFSNYSIRWITSSNELSVTRPVINFDNATMDLDITGIYATMDGFTYNGSSYVPEKAEYNVCREVDDAVVRSGDIFDNNYDGEWINLNLDMSGLNPGVYYVRARFEDNGGNAVGLSPKSNRFFVLGNLSVTAANVSYIGGMTQKINITGISVDNTTSLDVFTYTILDNNLNANTSISGILNYESGSQTWYASNIDVSTLPDGSYFVLGYFEDQSENKYGIGNISTATLDLFMVQHVIEVNQAFVNYTNQWDQQLEIGALASTSFQGMGVGQPLEANESIVTFQIFHNITGYSGLSGTLDWTGTSWNTTTSVSNLSEGAHFVQITFANNTDVYNTSGSLNSSFFIVDHVINITSISQNYVGNATQIVTVEITANTSYYGNGIGNPIETNPDVVALCTIVNNSNSQLTSVSGLAIWNSASSSWKADISTAPLPEGDYYIFVNFSVISNLYNASDIQNSSSFTISHILVLTVPTPIYHSETAMLDIVGIIATDSYSGYHHINDTTVLSTYFEIYNYTSNESIGIYGGLTYNSTFDDWRNTSIDLSTYPEGQYFICVNISSVDVPEGAAVNSSPFNLFHKIIISGISLQYTGGFQQTLNITVANAANVYQYLSSENITNANYLFFYRNNQTAVQNPNLGGDLNRINLTSSWDALANISKLPAGEYYTVVNFADPTAASSKGSKDTTNFTVIHSLNVSTPMISYIAQMDQILNISCFGNSSYYLHRNMNSSSFASGSYRIYRSNGTATSVTGSLIWNGTRWIVQNADVSLLPTGDYHIMCTLSTNYASANSNLSSNFSINHAIDISPPTVIFNNETKILNVFNVTAQSSYEGHGLLSNTTAILSYFEIFLINNVTTGIVGQLQWNGTEWQALNYAIPTLTEGQYYVKIYFNDSQTILSEISSDIFTVKYPVVEIDWVVVILMVLIVIAVAIVLFWSFFPGKLENRSEQS